MKQTTLTLLSILIYTITLAQPSQPNIIFVLVDDLGYGDIGELYQDDKPGNKFDTPFLDEMITEGMRIDNHYTVPVCAPSRASLLQGLNPGHTQIRNNQFDQPIPIDVNMAEVMKLAGYKTFIVGKHGIAGGTRINFPSHPLNHGFDDFFGYLTHVSGHEHYPRNGTTNKEAYLYEGKTRIETGTDKVYTTDVFTARAKQNIIDHVADSPNQPFFMYLAYDIPHFKLQIPTIAYPSGKGVNGGLQWTGPNHTDTPYVNTATGTIDSWHYPDVASQNWPENQKKHVTMIRRLGECMEDILVTLEDLDIDENTLVVFTSDNGAHNEGGQNPNYFESYGPLRGVKRDITEGGIRVPVIAWWPGTISPNSSSNQNCGMWNWTATFADAANRPIPARVDGASLLPILDGSQTTVEDSPPYVEYEHNSGNRRQMQFIRMGDYVGIRTNIENQSDPLQIYDIVNDTKQLNNLADDFPQLQQAMRNQMLRMRRVASNAPRPYDNALIPSIPVNTSGNGLNYTTVNGDFDYIPRVEEMQANTSGEVNNIDLSVRPRNNNFAILYNGFINIPADGEYTFYTQSDAPAHLMIHDIHVIGSDLTHTNEEVNHRLHLQQGYHPIKVYYQHNTQNNYTLNLSYSGPNISKQSIPNSAFFRGTQLPEVTTENFVNILHKSSSTILSGEADGNTINTSNIISEGSDSTKWATVDLSNGYFYLIQKSSGRKLHSNGDFSVVNTTAPETTGDEVQWRWVDITGDDWFRLEHKASGRWLHIGPNANPLYFDLIPTNNTGNNTRWRPENRTYINITHKSSSTMLSAQASDYAAGTSSEHSNETSWYITPARDGYFHIIHSPTGRKLHSRGDFSLVDITAPQWSGNNTQWRWVDIEGDDWYRLQHRSSGRWLHIGASGNQTSFRLITTNNTGNNTRWRPEVAPTPSSASSARLSTLQSNQTSSDQAFDFSIFPNPSNENITINLLGASSDEKALVTIADISGRRVYSSSIDHLNSSLSLELKQFKSGFYSVTIHYKHRKISKLLSIK